MMNQQQPQRIKVRHLCPTGHSIDLDNVSYGLVLMALTVAAEHDPERSQDYKRLRTKLSQSER